MSRVDALGIPFDSNTKRKQIYWIFLYNLLFSFPLFMPCLNRKRAAGFSPQFKTVRKLPGMKRKFRRLINTVASKEWRLILWNHSRYRIYIGSQRSVSGLSFAEERICGRNELSDRAGLHLWCPRIYDRIPRDETAQQQIIQKKICIEFAMANWYIIG